MTLGAVAASVLVGGIVGALMAGASPDAARVAAVFVALGGLSVALRREQWLIAAVALVGAWSVAVLAVRYLPDVIDPPPPVGQAVGGAAFLDTPYRGAQIAAVVSVAAPAVVALAAMAISIALARHRRQAVTRSWPIASTAPLSDKRSYAGMWIGAAVVAFTFVPDLRSYLNHAGDPLPYSWDASNLSAWQGFVQLGLVPMKDFFYPYGFQWLYTVRSVGPVFEWGAQIAMIALAGWSLWRLSGGRTWRVVACLLLLMVAGRWSPFTWRYLPALLVATTYGALGPTCRTRLSRGHLAFFLACLLAGLLEADLLVIGLVGALVVALGEAVSERLVWQPRRLAIAVVLDAVPVLASIAVIGIVWVVTGTAAGNIRFFGDLTAVSAQSALDERIYGPLGLMVLHPNAYSLYAALPALLAAGGFLWARRHSHESRAVATILLAGAGVSLVLVLKHFVRPIGDLLLVIPMIALAWCAIFSWRRDSIIRASACAAAVAAVLALWEESGPSLSHSLASAVASPVHFVRSIGVAFDRSARTRAARARLDPSRFVGWPDSVIAGYYSGTVPGQPPSPFAIIGDSAMTYVFLRQRPPYQVDLYDAGRLAEQRNMLHVLSDRKPAYLIWRRDFSQDGIRYDIRDPLIFAWMIKNYVPVRVFPTVDILRRRRAGEAVPVAFWRSQLTGTDDLRYIPSFSDAESSAPCVGGGRCVAYALVRGSGRGGGAEVGFSVSGMGAAYTVTLSSRPGVGWYPVRLDRLWFWPLVGTRPRLRSLTAGYTVSLAGRRSGDNLY